MIKKLIPKAKMSQGGLERF